MSHASRSRMYLLVEKNGHSSSVLAKDEDLETVAKQALEKAGGAAALEDEIPEEWFWYWARRRNKEALD